MSFYDIATDGALPAPSAEIGADDRPQTMKGVGVLHQAEVEVPAQHIIIHPLWFLLFSLSVSHFVCYFFPPPLFFISSLWLGAPPPFSAFVLLVPRLFLSPSTVFGTCHSLKSFTSSIFPPSLYSVICPTTFLFSRNPHLPFPHSASFSPWNLSNSPCSHSVVPLIACSFTLLFFPSWLFLPWQSDSCWSICH